VDVGLSAGAAGERNSDAHGDDADAAGFQRYVKIDGAAQAAGLAQGRGDECFGDDLVDRGTWNAAT
jgi:hypothetical protein